MLSVLNHDCAVAAAAARMVTAARGRPLIEMGSRRTHEEAAVAAARAAYLAGFAVHLQPGGRPALRHADRRHRRARVHPAARRRADGVRLAGRHAGQGTTLLVDTYDIAPGHPDRDRGGRAGTAARSGSTPATWRCSPSSPGSCSTRSAPPRPRSSSPATSTSTPSPRSPPSRSTCTAPAPPWSPAPARPTAGLVYKLVEVDGRPVVKRSENKAHRRRPQGRGAPAQADRHRDRGGRRVAGRRPDRQPNDRSLQRSFVVDGEPVATCPTSPSPGSTCASA